MSPALIDRKHLEVKHPGLTGKTNFRHQAYKVRQENTKILKTLIETST